MRIGSISRLAAVSVIFAGAASTQAATVSFDFGGGLMPAELAGAPGVRTGNWNPVTASGGGTDIVAAGTVKDDSGAVVTGASLTLVRGNAALGFNGDNTGAATNDADLFAGFFDQNNGTPSTITVTNIPFATYDVYFYMRNDVDAPVNKRTGEFSIGTANRFVKSGAPDPTSDGNGYVLSSDTTQTTGPLTNEGNFVVFSGLTGSTLNASFVAGATDDANPRNKVAGFQIVQTPEPASLSALGIAGATLLTRRRRNA